MKHLIIIPARIGSKRLVNKNLREINGKPLITYTLDSVSRLTSSLIDTDSFDVIISTDSPAIENICTNHVLYDKITSVHCLVQKRPPELGQDKSRVIELIEYIFLARRDMKYSTIGFFLPTCPIRDSENVLHAFNICKNGVGIDKVVSVTELEFPHNLYFHNESYSGIKKLVASSDLANHNTRSQDQPKKYRPTGSFHFAKSEAFDTDRSFFSGKVYAYVTKRSEFIDVDTERDLKIASSIMRDINYD